MEIKIDNNMFTDTIAAMLKESISAGMQSWSIKSQVEKATVEAVLEAEIPQLIKCELDHQLAEIAPDFVAQICREIIPQIRAAFGQAFRGALTAMVYGLYNGKPSYMSEQDQKKWDEVKKNLNRIEEAR